MTQKQIKKSQDELQKLWDYVIGHTDTKTWEKINKAVDLEILLEQECGK